MSERSEAARRLYLELAEHTSTVGAYSFAKGDTLAHLRLGERTQEIANELDTALGPPEPETERGNLLFHVPSPWHAVIHLLANNRGWLSGENGLGRQMSLLYRGQRNSRWPLMPSLYREGVDFDTESEVIYAFVDIVERILRSRLQTGTDIITPSLMLLSDRLAPPTPKVIHVGTAQHLGIRTPLLDFSFDPAVAVWFACQGARGDGSETASVFALPNRIGMVAGAAILLPHPYIRRLFRQRGLFVQPVSRGLRELCVEVRFPPDPSFEVVRDDLQRPDLLPDDAWWEMMVDLARRIAAKGLRERLMGLEDEGQWELFSFLMDACDLTSDEEAMLLDPKFMYMQPKRDQVVESAGNLLQMLLCMTTALHENDTPRVSQTAMRQCVHNSGITLSAMLPLMRDYLSGLPRGAVLRDVGEAMTLALENELGEQGYPVLGDGWFPA
jgi:hypothetical protein